MPMYFFKSKNMSIMWKKCHHDTPNKPKLMLGPM